MSAFPPLSQPAMSPKTVRHIGQMMVGLRAGAWSVTSNTLFAFVQEADVFVCFFAF